MSADAPDAPYMVHPFDITADGKRLVSIGMSLRDHFAGQALAGICATMTAEQREETDWSFEAYDAYNAADAMLQAREAKP